MEIINRPRAPTPQQTPLRHNGDPVRLIAIDIDGTITDMARRLDWNAVVALRAAEAAGIPVALATGNVVPVSKTIGHCIGISGPHICENGGVLYWEVPDFDEGGIQVHRELLHTREDPDRVVNEMKRRGHNPRRISSDPWRESETALELASTDEKVVEDTVRALGLDHLYVVSTGFACHILHKGVDKHEGLLTMIEWLNAHEPRFNPDHPHAQEDAVPLALNEVLAIGDSPNDVELIRHAGVGAVVAGATAEVRKEADLVAKHPHGQGVREILEGLGLAIPEGQGLA